MSLQLVLLQKLIHHSGSMTHLGDLFLYVHLMSIRHQRTKKLLGKSIMFSRWLVQYTTMVRELLFLIYWCTFLDSFRLTRNSWLYNAINCFVVGTQVDHCTIFFYRSLYYHFNTERSSWTPLNSIFLLKAGPSVYKSHSTMGRRRDNGKNITKMVTKGFLRLLDNRRD